MKQISSKKELVIALISGIGFIFLFYIGYVVASWIGMIIVLISLIFGAATAYVFFGLIINSIRFKVYTKKRIINISIAGLSLFLVIFQPVEMIIEKLKSPIVFGGSCEHTVTSVWIVLRQDNTFEYNAGAFLDRVMYYGKYEKLDSVIVLRFDNSKNVNTNDTLIITNDGLEELNLNMKHHHVFRGKIDKLI
jgi:hypothetical protein